ncbi:MAG TPA: hypothetical protein VKD22_03515, partial [Ramlibacter sp.]|nr:hypothetical protein [Ramlibacter sp.]
MATPVENTPAYVHPELAAIKPDLDLCAHLIGGTRVMQEHAGTYIRKWAEEKDDVYRIRSKCEAVFEGLGRTLSASVGMLFAKPPQMTWNAGEAAMSEHWQNIDAAGTAGPVFAKRFAETALRDGLGAILVDHPSAPEGVVVTSENEAVLNLRPTWAAYSRANVLSWRVGKVNNQAIVTQLVLYEPAAVDVGEFGVGTVDRYRVLRLLEMPNVDASGVAAEGTHTEAVWQVFEKRKAENGDDVFLPLAPPAPYKNKAGQIKDTLPVAIAYTG